MLNKKADFTVQLYWLTNTEKSKSRRNNLNLEYRRWEEVGRISHLSSIPKGQLASL